MKTICLSENANSKLKETLRSKGYRLIEIRKTDAVYDAVSSHGDIYLCKICDELVVAPEQFPLIEGDLRLSKAIFTLGVSGLDHKYPYNVKYNAAQMGGYLIHNTNHTDPVILSKAKEFQLELIHVKQGYTKCSLVVLDDKAAITSDRGLAAVLKKHDLEILLISPGHVVLTDFPYGFLGGASGKVDDEIIFNGNLTSHPDFEKIKDFICQRGLKVTWFEEYPLEDIGSIIQL